MILAWDCPFNFTFQIKCGNSSGCHLDDLFSRTDIAWSGVNRHVSSEQITCDNCMSRQLTRARILVQVAIYRRLLIGRDGHLDQSEAYDIS